MERHDENAALYGVQAGLELLTLGWIWFSIQALVADNVFGSDTDDDTGFCRVAPAVCVRPAPTAEVLNSSETPASHQEDGRVSADSD